MTFQLSEHSLWRLGRNAVTTMPPSPGDHFVVVTIGGRLALHGPVTDYERMVRVADAFARRIRGGRPVVVKVMRPNLTEAQAWGFAPRDLFSEMTPAEDAEWRQEIRTSLFDLTVNATDPKVRAEALELLREMGMLA